MPIRWRENDLRNLRQAVKRFNAKISRETKKNPAMRDFLPEKLSVKNLRNTITERKDFNKLLKSVDRFIQKGSTALVTLGNGITITKYRKRELQYARQSANARRAARRKKLLEYSGVVPSPILDMQTRQLQSIEDVKKENFKLFVQRLENESNEGYMSTRRDTHLANWTQSLFNVFGDNLANKILDATANIDRDTLQQAIQYNDALSIDFVYGPQDATLKAERLIDEIYLLEIS